MNIHSQYIDSRTASSAMSARPSAHLKIVEQAMDAGHWRILVVKRVERAGEAHRVAGVVAFVELLTSGERRDRGVEGEAKQLDAGRRVGVGRLRIGLDIGRRRSRQLSV